MSSRHFIMPVALLMGLSVVWGDLLLAQEEIEGEERPRLEVLEGFVSPGIITDKLPVMPLAVDGKLIIGTSGAELNNIYWDLEALQSAPADSQPRAHAPGKKKRLECSLLTWECIYEEEEILPHEHPHRCETWDCWVRGILDNLLAMDLPPKQEKYTDGDPYLGIKDMNWYDGGGELRAIIARNGELVRVHSNPMPTAGVLASSAATEGWVEALEVMGRFNNNNAGHDGAVISYDAVGRQYVSMVAGHENYADGVPALYRDTLISYRSTSAPVAFVLP